MYIKTKLAGGSEVGRGVKPLTAHTVSHLCIANIDTDIGNNLLRSAFCVSICTVVPVKQAN
jgi:hypothetical protein